MNIKIPRMMSNQTCRVCGCTDNDCSQCIEKTGQPCSWSEPNLCSACIGVQRYVKASMIYHFPDEPEREYKMDFNAYVTQDKEDDELKVAARAILEHIGWPEAVVNDITHEDAPEPEPVPGHDFSANFDDEDFYEFEDVE